MELLITGAIVAVVVVTIAVSFSSFSKNQGLSNATDIVLAAVNEARSKTLSSEGSNQFGVHFETAKLVVFVGPTYSDGSATNINFNLPSAAEISATSLAGGGANILFEKITGKTDQYGSVTIRLKVNTSSTRVISINSNGLTSI